MSITHKNATASCKWRVLLPREVGDRIANVNLNYHDHLERRGDVCGGELVVRGTRMTVRTLLASLSEGATQEEILADFPTVSAEGLRAVIAFAAVSAEEDLPVPRANHGKLSRLAGCWPAAEADRIAAFITEN